MAGDRGAGDPQHLWVKRVILPISACHMKRLSVTLRCDPGLAQDSVPLDVLGRQTKSGLRNYCAGADIRCFALMPSGLG